MRKEFGEKLLQLSKTDSKVYVLDGDLANSTRTNLVAEQNPSKFIQCGIAEQNMVSMAGGMAASGLQPWVVTFSPFLVKRALDQIIVSVAQPNLDVKLIGCYSGTFNGGLGKTHQAIEDIAIMRTIPNMTILCPVDGNELIQMMDWANNHNGPVYIRLTRESNNLTSSHYKFTINIYSPTTSGDSDVTILSTGTHSYYAERVYMKLLENNINSSFVHVPVIKPIDKDYIIEAAENSKKLVTIEDHSIIGGLGSAVTEIVSEYHPLPVLRIGINDMDLESGSKDELMDKYKLSEEHIYNKITEFLK